MNHRGHGDSLRGGRRLTGGAAWIKKKNQNGHTKPDGRGAGDGLKRKAFSGDR